MGPRNRPYRLSLAAAAAVWLLVAAGALEPAERLSMQVRHWLRPAPGFAAPVSVIAIDERALERYGRMPWERPRFAAILDRLHQAGAAVVGIDVAFTEPTAQDAPLASALARTPAVLPTFLAFAGAGGEALKVVEPLPALAEAAAGLGSVQLSRRQQQQIWELEPYQALLDRQVPAFPIAVAAAYLGRAPALEQDWWWRQAPRYIHFRGPAHSAPTRSVVDLLEGPLPRDLQGRIVLVGATANGLADTNFSVPDMRMGPMAGVEIFAHVIDNLLASGFWHRLSLPALAGLLALVAAWPGALLASAVGRGRTRHGLWAGASALWLIAACAAAPFGLWLEVVPVLALLFACYFGGLVAERGWLLASRNQLLERYASDMASEAQRQRARLEGELHDGIQQLLIAIGRELRQARKHLASPDKAESRLERAGGMAEDALAEIKRLRMDLLPPALRQGGLEAALPALAQETEARGAIRVSVEQDNWPALPQPVEVELYWLVKEALNNAEKHARDAHVTIRLAQRGADALVEVADDGPGFVPPDPSVPPAGAEHSGLHRMWLRMRGRGGDLVIEARPGHGCRLRFTMPRPLAERTPS